MKIEIIAEKQIKRRKFWIDELIRLSGDFGVDAEKVEDELDQEIKNDGIEALLGHLRLCGAIPEQYSHDSSEEKLYSKYTDVVIRKRVAATYFGFVTAKKLITKDHQKNNRQLPSIITHDKLLCIV
ncbi:MAG: HindIII family type II restriction endonuclease [Thermodesulfobacteriota bacterium]|nr:HindIII family type II restriction endonuclease [Thermodesulfobacteriota bacterium]